MREVSELLKDLALSEYEDSFAKNKIDVDVLPSLTNEDLKDIGVAAVGDRRRILSAIAALSRSPENRGEIAPARSGSATEETTPQTAGERRQITVMFCDLVGSTELSTRFDPEDMGAAIRAYHQCCAAVVARWDGHVANYLGDGVLVYFGWPRAGEDDAERAVRAGLEMTTAVGRLQTPLAEPMAARVGIATGLVLLGEMAGGEELRNDAVVGETPNLAARLQGLAEPSAIVVASSTRRLLGNLFKLGNLGEQPLKGFAEPVGAWRVFGDEPRRTRFEALRGRQMTPLIGRDDETALLLRRIAQVESGEGQGVVISGEAGIGKSRLCESLRLPSTGRPWKRVTYQCAQHQTNRAFAPVVAQLEEAAGIRSGLSPPERFSILSEFLEVAEASTELPVLAPLLLIDGDGLETLPKIDASQILERTYAALTNLVEGNAAKGPVLIVFEDLHWSDPSTLDWLNRLVERIETLPVLLLVTARPGLRLPWSDQPHVTMLILNRISKRECEEMLGSLTERNALSERTSDEIVRQSDGIPLFVEEMVLAVADLRSDAADGGALDSPIGVPASLQDSLMSRLDRLASGKQTIQAAAAIGREFTAEMLGRICDQGKDELEQAMSELVDSGLIVARGAAQDAIYTFKHALLQDAAYGSVLRDTRTNLHGRIASVLADGLLDDPALVAHHYELAGSWDEAYKCRLQAAQNAAKRNANWESAEQLRRAIDALGHLPDTPEHRHRYVEAVAARIDLGGMYRTKQERIEAMRQIDKAIELAADDLAVVTRLEVHKGYETLDELILASAERHAEMVGDKALRAKVAHGYAEAFGRTGRFEESLAKIEHALSLYESAGAHRQLGRAAVGAARCYYARAGELDRSLRLAGLAHEIVESTGDLQIRSWLVMETEPCLYKGLWERTVQVARQHLPAAWEHGQWSAVLWASAWAAIANLKLGNVEDARNLLEPAMKKAARRLDDDFCKVYLHIAACQLHLAEGETEAALNAAQLALELAERAEAKLEVGAARRALGQAHEARADQESADDQLRQSLAILGDIQSRPELAQSLLAYGQFKCAADRAEGGALLRRALVLFEEIDATGWVEETERALGSNA